MSHARRLSLFVALLAGCHGGADGPCGSITDAIRIPSGSVDGHADPAGARAAGQARAGRIKDLSLVRQTADARHPVRVGDYLLTNEKIAMYIAGMRTTDGYSPFGGKPISLDLVGDDGLPRGLSEYGETLLSLSGEAILPDSVSVIADGSDGGAAIVRCSGVMTNIPFLESFAGIFGTTHAYPAAIDYVLEPGAARVVLKLHLVNSQTYPIDLAGSEILGFFHGYRGQTFNDFTGFGAMDGLAPNFVAWDAGTYAFAFRMRGGQSMKYLLSQAGFELFLPSGAQATACGETVLDYAELIPAESLDSLREIIRGIDAQPASRAVTVAITDGAGRPLPGALVHAVTTYGTYFVRAISDGSGTATLHLPPVAMNLYATADGYESPPPAPLDQVGTSAALQLGATGIIQVTATELGSNLALPVRVQVLPVAAPIAMPASFGVQGEAFGRLHQVSTETGVASLVVPAGQHRVVVSRGWEYELLDQTVTVAAGQTVSVTAKLAHSVDSTGVMCADFHIHTFYSVDAPDPALQKVKGALGEGLELPVPSDHEYVIDYQPIIDQLGMGRWAHSITSEELTTFSYGHFGVIPKTLDEPAPNRGAVDWTGKQPGDMFAQVHALPEAPALIVNHPFSASFQGYFVSASFDLATATGDPQLYSTDFDALEVWNDSDFEQNRAQSVAAWFSLLSHGKRVYAVGSSDNHHMRTGPIGYPRTCIRFGHDDPTQVTPDQLRDAVKTGTSTIEGGLYMTVAGPGGVAPGGSIANATGKQAFDVVVQAPSWIHADTLEVIVDGNTTQTIALVASTVAGPGQRWEAPVEIDIPADLPPGGYHYVVFHASSAQDLGPVAPERHPFAVSNPIFF